MSLWMHETRLLFFCVRSLKCVESCDTGHLVSINELTLCVLGTCIRMIQHYFFVLYCLLGDENVEVHILQRFSANH
ncbi:hypothetical protein OG21DRAFT_1468708 [Imleria badia]|nr:hypothetical protein OG21DRAFT_1468708 [Imleria badia]